MLSVLGLCLLLRDRIVGLDRQYVRAELETLRDMV